MPPEIHGIQKGLSTGDGGVPAAAVPACGTGGAGGIKAATCAAGWPAGLDLWKPSAVVQCYRGSDGPHNLWGYPSGLE